MSCSDSTASAAVGFAPRRMTRCECADLAFTEIIGRLGEEELSLDRVGDLTGCGKTCTACIPDLEHYLASR